MADTVESARRLAWRRGFYRFRRAGFRCRAGDHGAVAGACHFRRVARPLSEHVAGGINTAARFQPPSWVFPFGTNELGQDVLSLVLAGARVSILAGLAVVLLGATVGTIIGAIAGYAGGWTDDILMRLTDLKLTVPGLILAMAVAAALGPESSHMVFAIALSWWAGFARLVRGEVMARKQDMFVTAARAIGAGRCAFCSVTSCRIS